MSTQDWTVVVGLTSANAPTEPRVQREVASAARARGGAVSAAGGQLLITVSSRELAEAVAADVVGINGVASAYPKPPVELP